VVRGEDGLEGVFGVPSFELRKTAVYVRLVRLRFRACSKVVGVEEGAAVSYEEARCRDMSNNNTVRVQHFSKCDHSGEPPASSARPKAPAHVPQGSLQARWQKRSTPPRYHSPLSTPSPARVIHEARATRGETNETASASTVPWFRATGYAAIHTATNEFVESAHSSHAKAYR
jgi:hypothetical protein